MKKKFSGRPPKGGHTEKKFYLDFEVRPLSGSIAVRQIILPGDVTGSNAGSATFFFKSVLL